MDISGKIFATLLVVGAVLQCAVAETTYVVGDSLGWRVPSDTSTYSNWASGKTFLIGDILTFNFATNEHDVLEVKKESYDACTSTNAIGSTITTGPANVTLNSSGDHYYICTFGSHCQSGQKLFITVYAPGSAPPSSPSTPSTPSSPSPSGTPQACAPTPTGGSPSSQTTPPPGSTASFVFANAFVSVLGILMSFF
ncbi:Phytocyanin domain, partial [Dillenia turbinata]